MSWRFAGAFVFLLAVSSSAQEADLGPILDKIRKGSPSDCLDALSKLEPGKQERAAKPIAIRLATETDAQASLGLKEALAAYKGTILVQAVKSGLEVKAATDDYRTIAIELLATEPKDETAATQTAKIAFESEFRTVREAAHKSVITFGDVAVKPVSAYLKGNIQGRANEACAALQAIDTSKAAEALVNVMVVGSEKELLRITGITSATRDEVAKALIAMGDEAVPALLSGLDSLNHQKWCSYCLQKISGEFYTQKDKAGWMGWWKRRLDEKAGK